MTEAQALEALRGGDVERIAEAEAALWTMWCHSGRPEHDALLVEILAGLVVAFAPRVGGWLVAAWLWAITLNLLSMPGYADVALRDAGLSLAALALARLATQYQDAIDPPRER